MIHLKPVLSHNTSNNRRMAVFGVDQNPETDKPIQHVKFKLARTMVIAGRAFYVGERSIQYLGKVPVVPSSDVIPGNRQGAAYESAAIDTAPQFVQGGLTRDEHKPEAFQQFKGARVGHQ